MKTSAAKKNRHILYILGAVVVAMFFFGYALVPLYNVLCNALGLNGKTENSAVAKSYKVDKSRTIKVQFLATTNENLPWTFKPNVTTIKVHPGQNFRVTYFAQNNSNHTMTVQAIPSVVPTLAANYLKKTECFCFTQQTLKAHASMDMPILLHIDTDLPKHYRTITLSYSLFQVDGKRRNKVSKARVGRIKS